MAGLELESPGGLRAAVRDAALLALCAFILYLATLAPTVLWGDDAELQRLAATAGAVNPGRGHALWLIVAHVLNHLPWGDAARRANLVSAICGALTLPFVVLATYRLTGRREAGILAGAMLAVSHTFWLHCVRAEVYTLDTLFLSLAIYLAIEWARRPEKAGPVLAAALVMGVGIQNSLLMVTALPALAFLILARAGRSRIRIGFLAAAAVAAGAAPYLVSDLPAAVGQPFGTLFSLFSPLRVTAREAALGAAYHLYQFPFGIFLVVPALAYLRRSAAKELIFLGLVYTGAAAFALSFHVNDQFVFYLPAYLPLAILAGAGGAHLIGRIGAPGSRTAARAAIWALCVLVPPAVYAATPRILAALDFDPLHVRDIPGRDASFFMWPPKNGYLGARRFAEGALGATPEGAVILAEWTSAEPLVYMQQVEGVRPDVTVKQLGAGWGKQVPYLLEQSAHRAVFIAGTGRHFDMDEIRRRFEVRPAGPIFALVPKGRQTPREGSSNPGDPSG